ncbi:hypothetical protein ACN9MY_23385 [Pseudoduganella sp. R-31]|uniref:hypothetical protein n=1 Tax=unclassified Pseudoduganella TaxID=2637179 RepID=UPI003CE66F6B
MDVASWIKTGKLGLASLGSNKVTILRALAEPAGWASTATPDEVQNYMDADLWGYGIWTLWFVGGALDAVTCAVSELEEHGWWFDVGDLDTSVFDDVNMFKTFLSSSEIPYRPLDGSTLTLRHAVTGTMKTKRRRLRAKTILAGLDLQTRILLDEQGKALRVMGSPYCAERQILSYSSYCSKEFMLL